MIAALLARREAHDRGSTVGIRDFGMVGSVI
jgi:hypothetical protein